MQSRQKDKGHKRKQKKQHNKNKNTSTHTQDHRSLASSSLVHDFPEELKKLSGDFSSLIFMLEKELALGSKMNAAHCAKQWRLKQEQLVDLLNALSENELGQDKEPSGALVLEQLSYVLNALDQLDHPHKRPSQALEPEQLLSTLSTLDKMKTKPVFNCAHQVNAITKRVWSKIDELQSKLERASHNERDAIKDKLALLEQCLPGLISLEERAIEAERLHQCFIAQSDLLRVDLLLDSNSIKFSPLFGITSLSPLQSEWQKMKKAYEIRINKEREACNILSPGIEALESITKNTHCPIASALHLKLITKRKNLRAAISSRIADSKLVDHVFVLLDEVPHLYGALSKHMEKRLAFSLPPTENPHEKIKAMKSLMGKMKSYLNNNQATYQTLFELTVRMKKTKDKLASQLSLDGQSILDDIYHFLVQEQNKIEALLKKFEATQRICNEKLNEYAREVEEEQKSIQREEVVAQFRGEILGKALMPQDLMRHFSKVHKLFSPDDDFLLLYSQVADKLYSLCLSFPAGHFNKEAKSLALCFSQFLTQYVQVAKPKASSRAIIFSIFQVLDKLRRPIIMDEREAYVFMQGIPENELTPDNLLLLSRLGFPIADTVRMLASPKKLAQICLTLNDVDKLKLIFRIVDIKAEELVGVTEELERIESDIAKRNRKKEISLLRTNIASANTVNEVVHLMEGAQDILAPNDASVFTVLVAAFTKASSLHQDSIKANRNPIGNLAPLFSKLAEFQLSSLEDLKESNPSKLHFEVIKLVIAVNQMEMRIPRVIQNTLEELLSFKHIYGVSLRVCYDILVCAQAGFDISRAIVDFIDSGYCKELKERDVTSLLMACCFHDVTYPHNPVPREAIDKLFALANEIYFPLVGSKDESDLWKNKIFGEDKFEGGACRDSESHRRLLQAASFYCFPLNTKLFVYLNSSLTINGNETVSPKQKQLMEMLAQAFKPYPYIKVFCEKRVDCGFSLDILIENEKTKKRINVEYDGMVGHYYRDFEFQSTYEQLRKDLVQDDALRKHNYEVHRFNHKHLYGQMTAIKQLIIRIEPQLEASLGKKPHETRVRNKDTKDKGRVFPQPNKGQAGRSTSRTKTQGPLFFNAAPPARPTGAMNVQPEMDAISSLPAAAPPKLTSSLNPKAAAFRSKRRPEVGMGGVTASAEVSMPFDATSHQPPFQHVAVPNYIHTRQQGYLPSVWSPPPPQAFYPNITLWHPPGHYVPLLPMPDLSPQASYEGEEPEGHRQQETLGHEKEEEQSGPIRFSRSGQ